MAAPSSPFGASSRDGQALGIGALAPMTQPGWAEAGRHMLAGVAMAVQDVNSAGGVGGCPLELLVRDTAADPAKAAAAVEGLAGLGVAALVGEYHSVAAQAAAAKADDVGLPFLCSSAVLDDLTEQPTDWVARIAPPQSRGWRRYAEFLLGAGHRHVVLATVPSIYWASGARILRDFIEPRGGQVVEIDASSLRPAAFCDELARSGASALLLLVGYPEPAVSIVRAVRGDPRLAGILIGAPAGQPEFAEWASLLGVAGTAIPFLRYLPERLTPLGVRVQSALREQLGETPSFVALEGYDAITVLAEALRLSGLDTSDGAGFWSRTQSRGTRGTISFSRPPGGKVWQWADAPIEVVDRAPGELGGYRTLATADVNSIPVSKAYVPEGEI